MQVGGAGGSELLAPWPEAMGLINQLPSLPGLGERNYAAGHVLTRSLGFSIVSGAVSNGSSGFWSSGPSGPVWAVPGWGRRLGRHRVR